MLKLSKRLLKPKPEWKHTAGKKKPERKLLIERLLHQG